MTCLITPLSLEHMNELESLDDPTTALASIVDYAGIKMEFDFQEHVANTDLPKPLLILDLNGTLLVSSWRRIVNTHHKAVRAGKRNLYIRPHLEEFLRTVFEHFRVAVWSSHSDENTNRIVEAVFTPAQRARLYFVWGRSKCFTKKGSVCDSASSTSCSKEGCGDGHVSTGHSSIKSFANIVKYVSGECLERTIIVDDSPEKIRGFRHHYKIKSYDETSLSCVGGGLIGRIDCELKKLGEWLMEWKDLVESLPLPPEAEPNF